VTRIVEDARFDAKLTKLAMPGDEGKPPVYPSRLVYYYATHLRIVPQPSFIFDTTGFEEAKRRAIMAYHTQFVVNEKNRGVVEWVEAAGRFFGSRIGARSGEPFFLREPLGVRGLEGVG
jgi:LmbE family N-acetylglucosaminyl deacetylase